jgi:GNAT superfamily N-acetyltransferase
MAMCVDENYRDKGVGSVLIEEAEDLSKRNGCVKIAVASGLARLATHEFYRSKGYEEITKRFVKRL